MSDKTITLLKIHTNNGKKYPPGTQLTFSTRIADWLIAQRVAEETPSGTAPRRATPIPRASCCGRR